MQTRRTTRRSIAAAELGAENDLSNRVATRPNTASTSTTTKPVNVIQKPVITRRTTATGKSVLGDKVRFMFFQPPSKIFHLLFFNSRPLIPSHLRFFFSPARSPELTRHSLLENRLVQLQTRRGNVQLFPT